MAFSLESIAKFAASMSAEQRAKINVLAYFDGSALTAPTTYFDFSDMKSGEGPVRRAVTHDLQLHRPSADAGQGFPSGLQSENSGSPEALLNFVRWCTNDSDGCRGRKARNYALIVSGHSLGFHGNTFLHDERTGKHFTVASFRKTLEEINSLYLKGQSDGRIAILGFDSCLMSMLEVGYELKNVAKTVVASQGSLPNTGWGYAEMLGDFVAGLDSGADTGALAARLVRAFTNYHRGLALGGRAIDISAWDLDKAIPLARSVNRLGSCLNELLDEDRSENGRRVSREVKRIILQSHYDSQTYMMDQCVDIKDLCQRLLDECCHTETSTAVTRLTNACGRVIATVDDCVLMCGYSGDTYQFSNGISMFFPWSSLSFAFTDAAYRNLRFVGGDEKDKCRQPLGIGSAWYEFLLNYVGNITLRRSRKVRKNTLVDPTVYGNIDQSQSGALVAGTRDLLPYLKGAHATDKDMLPYLKGAAASGKDMLPYLKGAPDLSKDMLPYLKGESVVSKDLLPYLKGMAENKNYLAYFGRFKNFELGWEISGFTDERPGGPDR